ncbi:MAG: signal peptide peptidase SppA [Bacteroidota bacterium]
MKSFFASCLGTFVALVVLILLGILIFSSLAGEKEVMISDNSVLHLKLEFPINEQEVEDPLSELFPGAGNQSIGLIQLKQAIKYAKSDDKIKGIYLNINYLQAGISTIGEIRESLLDFRSSGKWVLAYSDVYTEGAYYLASSADHVYLNPQGQIEFNGLAAEVIFLKKMFDKLEIKPQVFRVGDFKSAVEPFLRDNLSDENKLQLNSMLNSVYGEMLNEISESRKMPKDKLKEISDNMMVQNAKQALEFGLVDTLYYEDQLKDELREKLNLEKDKDISLVKYSKYRKSFSTYKSSPNEVAVIVADGTIMPGEADQGIVGSADICEEIRKARTNEKVKAIVIRINSPGGVFQAGDQMWREITLATQEKPVIASMADYAASGGYYMAMACDTIVAQPTTITGSIGVFLVLYDLSQFMDNKLGITSEEVKTGKIGEPMLVMPRSLTDVEKDILQRQVNEIYETFTAKAAAGRHMSQGDIKKIASGRVWTGTQAKDNGLVDVLGGFDDAIALAAKKGGVADDYKVRYYPKQKNFLEKLMGDFEQNTKSNALKIELGEYYPWYQRWQKVKDYKGVQARMPFEFEIK